MSGFNYDLVYVGVTVALTAGAAWKLHSTGKQLLAEILRRDRELAGSVNQLLLSSFCLIMLGYLGLTVRFFGPTPNFGGPVNFDISRFGALLLFLGTVLFAHVFVLGRMGCKDRSRANHGDSILA